MSERRTNDESWVLGPRQPVQERPVIRPSDADDRSDTHTEPQGRRGDFALQVVAALPPVEASSMCRSRALGNGTRRALGNDAAFVRFDDRRKPVIGDSCLLIHQRSLLPKGVPPQDPAIANREEGAAEDVDATATGQRAGGFPLGHAGVLTDHEVTAITPVRVRHGVEHISERSFT